MLPTPTALRRLRCDAGAGVAAAESTAALEKRRRDHERLEQQHAAAEAEARAARAAAVVRQRDAALQRWHQQASVARDDLAQMTSPRTRDSQLASVVHAATDEMVALAAQPPPPTSAVLDWDDDDEVIPTTPVEGPPPQPFENVAVLPPWSVNLRPGDADSVAFETLTLEAQQLQARLSHVDALYRQSMDDENALKELIETLKDHLCMVVARRNAVDVKRETMTGLRRLKSTRQRLESASKRTNDLAKQLAVLREQSSSLTGQVNRVAAQVRYYSSAWY